MVLIEARNLVKIYKDDVETTALGGVDLSIEEGEFVAIMGQSGSGKSTLLHILGFLDRHTKGEYFFNKKTIDDYSSAELAHIRNKEMGFVFQAFNLLARSTVIENVKLPLLYSDIPEKKWDELSKAAVAAVGLSHRQDHEASKLSGGEKQRVAIARALINNPKVIFADEPTGNLDSKSGQQVMEIFEKLHDEMGHTVVLITHETYTAEHAERIIQMLDGKIEMDQKVKKRLSAKEIFIK